MIYIFAGSDSKKINAATKALIKERPVITISLKDATKEMLLSYAGSVSLFGDTQIILLDEALKEKSLVFNAKEIERLKNSSTIFIFRESSILAPTLKKFANHATIERFDESKPKVVPTNPFAITMAYGNGDKMKTWMLYRENIEKGASPEAISGLIFWKIKSMFTEKSSIFSVENLKKQSSDLVTLYHLAHRGEYDLTIGLEQFILTSLTK